MDKRMAGFGRMAVMLSLAGAWAWALPVRAGGYETRVVASGLIRPTGIVAKGNRTLYVTQLPTPGVPGSAGGGNTVDRIRLGSGELVNLTMGEPEPTHLALDRGGTLYWTCKSAGVILQRDRNGGVSPFLTGLTQPSGIAVDRWGIVYFTQIPTPGVGGGMGGLNTVSVSDGVETQVLTTGEPEPTDITVGHDGTAYWTCKSAGVILRRAANGEVSLLVSGLNNPVGIDVDSSRHRLFFTEVPTPGVPGSAGGGNRVSVLDLLTGGLDSVDEGDPEPTDITVAPNGSVYWTCSSAGVIVQARDRGEWCDWDAGD